MRAYCYKEECQRKGIKLQKDKGNIVRRTERQAVTNLWGYLYREKEFTIRYFCGEGRGSIPGKGRIQSS